MFMKSMNLTRNFKGRGEGGGGGGGGGGRRSIFSEATHTAITHFQ